MTLEWHPLAEIEFAEAAVYYESHETELGERFVDHVEDALERLLKDPERPRLFDGEHRRVFLKKFPYQVIYRIKNGKLEILTVKHERRDSDYWRERSEG